MVFAPHTTNLFLLLNLFVKFKLKMPGVNTDYYHVEGLILFSIMTGVVNTGNPLYSMYWN